MYGHGYIPDQFFCRIQALADALVYSSVYLSLASCAMMYIASMFQGISPGAIPLAIGFCITFSIYNLNRKSDEVEDGINHASRYAFTKKYERMLLSLAVAAYAGALLLSFRYGAAAAAITAFPLLCGILYSFPLLPRSTGFRRLKDIPLGKNLTISCAWTVPHVLLPVVLAGKAAGPMTWVTSLFFFSLVFVNTVIFDMRDVGGDAAAGIRTVPVLLGTRKTSLLLAGLCLVAGAVAVSIALPVAPLWQVLILLLGTAYGTGYVLSFGRIGCDHALCDLLADGQFIVIGAFLFVAARFA